MPGAPSQSEYAGLVIGFVLGFLGCYVFFIITGASFWAQLRKVSEESKRKLLAADYGAISVIFVTVLAIMFLGYFFLKAWVSFHTHIGTILR